jgi:2'-hydroxyisoflavone reductase
MRLLLLGGSTFLGPAIIDAAHAGGHDVTTFTRGTTPIPRLGVTSLVGDRDGDLRALESGSWDAVIDTSGYDPRLVQASAELLAPRVGRYVFVSTISVYAPDGEPLDEDASLVRDQPDGYGGAKVLCEDAVAGVYRERCAIARPGLIVGPGDPTGRFTYWAHRIARGGEVVAFDRPDRPLQVVDVRDLAAWLVRACEQDLAGTFNVTGPAEPLTWAELFVAAVAVTGSDARAVYVPEDTLQRHEVGEWMELPLWINSSSPDVDVSNAIVIDRALAAGLTFRPLAETIAGALTAPLVDGVGLTPEREQAILTGYRR